MTTLPAFTDEQGARVHALLALTVAEMMGRKLEEADWSKIYCAAKGIPDRGWSNLNIDVMDHNLGVEHKMLCYRSKPSIEEACGTTLMHPSATRSIRIETTDAEPNDVMNHVLGQYAELIAQRKAKVEEHGGSDEPADMRTGWLLWKESLSQFLYFEERMAPPDPNHYYAEWHEIRGTARKPSKNLWIYEKSSGRKRYSVTTSAGIKIQPYFDVPPPTDPHVYIWTIIGEHVNGMIRVWLTRSTTTTLKQQLGALDEESIDCAADTAIARNRANPVEVEPDRAGEIVPVLISVGTYVKLQEAFQGINDEHLFQMLIANLPS